eukprot:m.68286 g.68286  ORF g.68286 m.68286 type:complete len:349 (-) comp14173_c0_seq1:715-1761(-)
MQRLRSAAAAFTRAMSYQSRQYPNLAVPRTRWSYKVEEPEANVSPQAFIHKRIDWFDDEHWREFVGAGRITLSRGAALLPVAETATVQFGDVIEMVRPLPDDWFDPIQIPVDILHDDGSLLWVNKPPGLLVQPAGEDQLNNLLSALHARFRNTDDPSQDRVPHLAHRIDRFTSGLVLLATTEKAKKHLSRQFEERKVNKDYLALVHGHFPTSEGEIVAAIDKDHDCPYPRYFVGDKGKESLTQYRVLETFAKASLVIFKPVTGRTHQIRVHAAHAGHPLLGDAVYGLAEDAIDPSVRFERCALHSHRLSLIHPISKQLVAFEAPLAPDMKAMVERLRAISAEAGQLAP